MAHQYRRTSVASRLVGIGLVATTLALALGGRASAEADERAQWNDLLGGSGYEVAVEDSTTELSDLELLLKDSGYVIADASDSWQLSSTSAPETTSIDVVLKGSGYLVSDASTAETSDSEHSESPAPYTEILRDSGYQF